MIDIGSVINEKIAPRYDWPDKKELNEAMVKIYKAVIAKLEIELAELESRSSGAGR